MIPAFLLALREGLEAALIIGIVLGALRKMKREDQSRIVWLGTAAAVFVSVAAALVLWFVGAQFEGRSEELFEGLAMLTAAGVLTWMIFWMRAQASQISAELESDVKAAVLHSGTWALFSVAFLAVVREGIELALFLTATSATAGAQTTLIGALAGLATVIILSWAFFSSLIRLDVRKFFTVTSVLLIIFAAGLVAHGVHELNEAGIIPGVIEHVWDINNILDEDSYLGLVLKTLVGYNGNPSLTEVIAYVAYYLVLFLYARVWQPRPMARQTTSTISG